MREAFYQSSISPLSDNPLIAADFSSIETILSGVRDNGSMEGNVTILFKYKDNPEGTMINTLRNDIYAESILGQFFSNMTYHVIDLTENNTLRYYAEGTFNVFAVSAYDNEIHTTVSSSANNTNAVIVSSGNYSETAGNNTVFSANFAPAFGIALNATNLTITTPANNTVYNGGQTGTGTLQFTGIPEEGVEIVSANETPNTDSLAPKIRFLYPPSPDNVITAGEDIIYSIEEQHLDRVSFAFDGTEYRETDYTGVVKTHSLTPGAHTLVIIANDSFGYAANATLKFQTIDAATETTQATPATHRGTTTTTLTEKCKKAGNKPTMQRRLSGRNHPSYQPLGERRNVTE